MLCLANMIAFLCFSIKIQIRAHFVFIKSCQIKGKTSWDEGLISDENKTQVLDAVNSVEFVVIFVRRGHLLEVNSIIHVLVSESHRLVDLDGLGELTV